MAIAGDKPIVKPEDDLLDRARPGRVFAEHLLSLDYSDGLVVGVLGPWGSGKTSFVNLVRGRLTDLEVPVLEINPWMFSGADQLVDAFFVELAAQLRVRRGLGDIGKDVEEYGESLSALTWVPLVGVWIQRGWLASKYLAKILQRRREGIAGQREKLEKALAALEVPIVVVLDDIDRLTTAEIRDVFKLVRLTANFPNIIYLVAFDRQRVENALTEEGIGGRDYLEKILQIGIDLPAIPPEVLNNQVFTAINEALEGIEAPGPLNQGAWLDAYVEIIRPLLRNMRDVRRYAAAIHGTVKDLGGRVELTDVLSLEAVRVFLPDVFHELPASVEALTATRSTGFGAQRDPPRLKAQIDRLLDLAGDRAQVVTSTINRLFPAAERHVGGMSYGDDFKPTWRRERRVAHEDFLRLYLERSVGANMQAFVDAEQAWFRLDDREALDRFLRSLDRDHVLDVIAALDTYKDQFQSEHVVPATIVLLNLFPDLPKRERGMLDLDTRLVVTRLTAILLQSLPNEATVGAAIGEILPELSSLSAKLEVVSDVGHREGRGHRLLSETVAANFERNWRGQVRSASVDQLLAEPQLLQTLLIARREAEEGEPELVIDSDPRLTAAILASASTETLSQLSGSRTVQRSARLAWDALIDVFGSEDVLRRRIDTLRSSDVDVEGLADLLVLADKYLSGWRPDDFGPN